jgi:hypothetical protein
MISIRSAATMFSHRSGGAASRLLPTMSYSRLRPTVLPEPSSEDHRPTIITTARRHLTSPAYRRYLKNQHLHHSSLAPSLWDHSAASTAGHGGVGGGQHRQKRSQEVPSLRISKAMPVGFSEMGNDPLLTIAEMGNHAARVEVLKRHIMAVDNVDYVQASETFRKIEAKNREGLAMAILPYQMGIAVAMIVGFGSIPLVFDIHTAMWFNHHYVTMELPEPNELDTYFGT